jgi:hypothetical protein
LPYLNQLPQLRSGSAPGTLSQPGTLAQMAAHGREVLPGVATSAHGIADEIVDTNDGLRPLSARDPVIPQHEFGSSALDSRLAGRPDPVLLANGLKVIQAAAGEVLIPIAPAHSAPLTVPGAGFVVSATAPVPLHHPGFAEGFSQQVTLMASDGVQHARITINPPELGPVELRIVVRNEEAAVQLASQHGAVRDALEEALPRLREQFDQAGLRLTDSGVFSELPGRSEHQGDADENIASDAAATELELAETHAHLGIKVHHGFVDAYV